MRVISKNENMPTSLATYLSPFGEAGLLRQIDEAAESATRRVDYLAS